MRLLFLSTRFPFPVVGGEKLRPFYFIKYLASKWKITLLCFSESANEEKKLKDSLPQVTEVHTVTLPRLKSYLNCLGGLFIKGPLENAYYAHKKMHRLVQKEINSGGYDLVFCHLVRMAPYVEKINGIKKVLDICDALSLRYRLSSRYRRGPFKFIEWLESQRLTRYEANVANKFDLNLVSSYLDKRYLEEEIGLPGLEVVENGGIDSADLGQPEAKVDLRKVVFFGNLRTFHNVDAVRYFYKKIFPLIKEKVSDARFVIVGANIPRCILQLRQDPAVSVFADVSDLRYFIEDACISVAPLRISVGIQNKILQSMAQRIPVVATTLGLGGIRAEPDKEILIADAPGEFAKKTVLLMQDVNLRNQIRQNAYRLVKEQYLWPDICGRLNKKLNALLQK
jgi:sugar transferase (PEP-CTERM/EpsH1 system associated)